MKNPVKILVAGQSEMLKINAPLVGVIVGTSIFMFILWGVTRQRPLFDTGLSLAVIDLTIAYLMGQRLSQKHKN